MDPVKPFDQKNFEDEPEKILVPGIESFDYIKRDSQTSDIENYHREQKNLENIHKEPSDVEKEVIHGNRMEKTKKKSN